MTKTELAEIAKQKDEFLQGMVHKHGLALEYIVRLLKAHSMTYNKAKEGEIDELISTIVEKEIVNKRAELKAKIEANPILPSDKCWLATAPGVMCSGTINRNGVLPVCTEGGVSHYFAMRSSNPAFFLERYEFVKKERERVREEELKHYREGIAKPFNAAQYSKQESLLE